MLVYFSQLKNRRVVQDKSFLGKLQDLVINLTNGVVAKIIVDDDVWDAGKVIKWNNSLVLGANQEDESGYSLPLGLLRDQIVYAKSGNRLGVLVDYQIDTVRLMVTQIVVKQRRRLLNWFPRLRIFTLNQVYSITPTKITVKEDLKAVKITKDQAAYNPAY